jgi:hypothetical protein
MGQHVLDRLATLRLEPPFKHALIVSFLELVEELVQVDLPLSGHRRLLRRG